MEHFYKNIEGWFDFEDIYKFAIDNFSSGAHFVEIGSMFGASASYMAVEIINSKKDITFDCIDIWDLKIYDIESDDFYHSFLRNTKPVSNIINPKRGYSNDIVHQYKDNSIDFVFIDAEHTYESVKEDLTLWFPKVKRDGIIAGHDYTTHKDVKKAVDEFFNEYFIYSEACTDDWSYSWLHNSWFVIINDNKII